MTTVLLFHHVQGLTPGVQAFADRLRTAGHEVVTPDLFGGRTFDSIDDGMAFRRQLGDDLDEAADRAAAKLPPDVVHAGFSLGVMPAQRFAQTRPGARGALLFHGGIPLGAFAETWPDDVPLQAHVMRDDDLGDVADLTDLVAAVDGELFLYDGDDHLFTDASLAAHDPEATALVLERTLDFLDRVA